LIQLTITINTAIADAA